MELKEILAISGQPGLYKFVAQSVRGVIVESLLDGRRMNASANAKVSALSEISMFTEGEDIALADDQPQGVAREAESRVCRGASRVRPRPGACFGHQEVFRVVQHAGRGGIHGVQTSGRERIAKNIPARAGTNRKPLRLS